MKHFFRTVSMLRGLVLSGRRKNAQGFSLVEVTMALGLMSFCLVTMLGLLPVGLKQERLSAERTRSFEALSAVAADIAIDRSPANRSMPGTTARYQIPIPNVAAGGSTNSFYLDERFDKVAGATGAAFKVWYEITAPSHRFDSYRIRLGVANAAESTDKTAMSSLTNRNYVEAFTTKSAF